MLDEDVMRNLISKINSSSDIPSRLFNWDNLSYDKKYHEFKINFLIPLRGRLHDGWVGVKFIKTNGEMRDMVCTLKKEYLPKRTTDKETKGKSNQDIVTVWSRYDNDWRSFRLDSIKEVWQLIPIIMDNE